MNGTSNIKILCKDAYQDGSIVISGKNALNNAKLFVFHGKKYAIWYQQRMIRWGYRQGLDKMTVSEAEEYRERIRCGPESTGNWFFDHVVRGIY